MKKRGRCGVFWFKMLGRCSEAVVMARQVRAKWLHSYEQQNFAESKGTGNKINKIVDQ